MRGSGRARRAFRVLRRKVRPAGVILLYHRIADLPDDPYSMAVSVNHFAQQLAYIKHAYHPVSVLELAEGVRRNSIPRRAVAITFDDGYVDFLTNAYPLLRSAQIPATVFAISGIVDNPREMWWDKLERLLLRTPQPPAYLELCLEGRNCQWETASAEQRQLAFKAIHAHLRALATDARDGILADLAGWAGAEPTGCPDHRPMTATELSQLAQDGLVIIGAHTVSHPSLCGLPPDAQVAEIAGSRQMLESSTGSPVLTFSYPYGTAEDFTDETVSIVQAAGFRAACTAIRGYVESGTDPFRLPRCWVENWDLDSFKRYLDDFFISW